MFKLMITLCMILMVMSHVDCARANRPKSRQINKLDDSQFPVGSKIGFSCRKFQPPLSRSRTGKKKSIFMTSTTIIRSTTISINGELSFHLKCKRDVGVDKGEVVAPSVVEKELKAEGITEASLPSDGGEQPIGGEPKSPDPAPLADPIVPPSSPEEPPPPPAAVEDLLPASAESAPVDAAPPVDPIAPPPAADEPPPPAAASPDETQPSPPQMSDPSSQDQSQLQAVEDGGIIKTQEINISSTHEQSIKETAEGMASSSDMSGEPSPIAGGAPIPDAAVVAAPDAGGADYSAPPADSQAPLMRSRTSKKAKKGK